MWELIFMMLILKIPIVYLACVVYWAIKAEPKPLEGAPLPAAPEPRPDTPFCSWPGRRRSPRVPRPWTRGRVRAARRARVHQ